MNLMTVSYASAREALCDLTTLICRPVVDDDYFNVPVGLVEHTLYSLGQIACVVIDGDNNAD
jgi:hypothetical protein